MKQLYTRLFLLIALLSNISFVYPAAKLLTPETVTPPSRLSSAAKEQPIAEDISSPDEITEPAAKKEPINIGQLSFIKKIPMPNGMRTFLNKLTLENAGVNKIEGGTELAGTINIDKTTVEGKFHVIKQAGAVKMSFLVGLPNGFKFGNIDKNLAPLDTIQLIKGALVFSQYQYTEEDWNLNVNSGVNFLAVIQATGQIGKTLRFIGNDFDKLQLQGSITFDVIGSYFKATLPGKLKLGGWGETTGLSLALYIKELAPGVPNLAVGISTGILVRIPSQVEPLSFIGEIQLSLNDVFVNGWMDGFWQNAMGIKGFRVGNATVGVRSDFTVAAASGGILGLSGFCLGGAVGFGRKELSLSACVSVSGSQVPDIILAGEFKGGLYLSDIVEFSTDVIDGVAGIAGAKLNLTNEVRDKLPNIGFDTAKLYVVPKDTFLAGKLYEKGFELAAAGTILDTHIGFDIKIKDKGINGIAYLKTKIGPLTITGAGPDKKMGTADDAAVIMLNINPLQKEVALFADGYLYLDVLDGLNASARIDLSQNGIYFKMAVDIFKEFKAMIEVKAKIKIVKEGPATKEQAEAEAKKAADSKAASAAKEKSSMVDKLTGLAIGALTEGEEKGPTATDFNDLSAWSIAGSFEQTALSKLGKIVGQAAREMVALAKKDIEKAKQDVYKLDKEIEAMKARIKRTQDANLKAIADAKKKIGELDTLKAKLDAAVNKCTGKKPEQQKAVNEFVKGEALTKAEVDKVVDQLRKDNPDMSKSAIEAIKADAENLASKDAGSK